MQPRTPWALICIGITLVLAWLFWYTQQPVPDERQVTPVSVVSPDQHIQDLKTAAIAVPIPSFHDLF